MQISERAIPRIPGGSLIGGNAREFGRDGLAFYEMCDRMGPIVKGRAYVFPFYVVTGPTLIEEILIKKAAAFEKPGLLKGLHLLFGDGLLTADGEGWRHRRRLLQPVFHANRNSEYAQAIQQGIGDRLSSWPDRGRLDVHQAVIEICISNLTRTLFGVDDAILTRDIRTLADLCHEMTQAAMSFRFPYYGLLAMFPCLAEIPFGSRVRSMARAIVDRVTALRDGTRCDDFFSRLTSGADLDGCPFGKKVIYDELITMLLAGHETAAAATSWALYLLAQHPMTLSQLSEQLDRVCGEQLPRYEDLDNLPLLHQVLLEAYRLYPPTHRIGRRVKEPVSIGGFPLELGAQVLIPQWAVHRSPRHYEAPLEFRPDRWQTSGSERQMRCAFFPFSAGPRVCIGRSLVMMEDALVLASIVKCFTFSLPDGLSIKPREGLTLLPGEGSLPLDLVRRRAGADNREHHCQMAAAE